MENTIQYKFTKVFEIYSDSTAIEYGNKTVTYGELNRLSDLIADMLYKNEVMEKAHVGIFVEDKIKLITAIIGILKSKCVFVTLDTLQPEQRLEYMAQSTDTRFILTEDKKLDAAKQIFKSNINGKLINIDCCENCIGEDATSKPIYNYSLLDPIYMFFTSGSTGRPKAIIGKNESLSHFIDWETEALGVNKNIRVSQITSSGFDAILRDIFVPLCSGGTICIPESREVILDKIRLCKWIEESNINIVHCTPSIFSLINSEASNSKCFPNLKYIMMAGEKINPAELKRWYNIMGERIQLVNLYGPTETTMIKTFYLIKFGDINRNSIPIGKGISGTNIYVLNEDLSPCADGETGEIYIQTQYMTLGYYQNNELNRERFIKNPHSEDKNSIIYKTGDLGRVLPDGNLEFKNRIDRQIKVRGNRIELGEIESELLTYPGIDKSIVDIRNNSEKQDDDEINYCSRCGLPSSFPNTNIDDENICNVCREYDEFKGIVDPYFKSTNDLNYIFNKARSEKKGEYDCLLLYSGGKDSTYVLYKLMEMGVRVLAYTFDNGYISETALKSIKSIVKTHNIDHITGTLNDMPAVFHQGLKEECSICNGCFKVLRILSTKLAYEKGIKYIVTGLSRGQIYDVRLYDIMKQGAKDVEEIERKIYEQRLIYHTKDDYVSRVFERQALIKKEVIEKVELIDFYRYCDVGKREILEFLKSKSAYWNSPEDTGFCSSNCLINDVGIYMQRKFKKYDNYTFPNSWEVRLGHISLEDSRKELKSEVDYAKVKRILKEIDCDEDFFEDNKGEYLTAYYMSSEEIQADLLRNHLRQRLPEYMIPSSFIRIETIPLTPNGKLDYKALPDPVAVTGKIYTAPRDETEIKLSEIWSEILGIDDISVDDNFLEIGVHSLNIMTMISRVYEQFEVELPLEEVFNNATIEKIAAYIKRNEKVQYEPIQAVDGKKYYFMSSAQKRVFTNEQIEDTGTGYNLSLAFIIKGVPDIKRLETAFLELIRRHESLRTSFQIIDGEPFQVIHNEVEFKLSVLSLNGRDLKQVINEQIKPFDLRKAPLLRAGVIKISEEKYVLVLDVHHIVADGKSMLILQRDLSLIYEGKTLPDMRVQYKDFAQWQSSYIQSENMQKQESFWLDTFDDFKPGKGIPTDFAREKARSFAGDSITWEIGKPLSEKLYKIAAENKTTLFMLILAGFNVLFAKYSASEDITIGSPIEGRRHPDLSNVVGMFVNTLAIRSYPSAEKSFRSYLQEVKWITLKAYENQDYQFDMLVKKLNLHSKADGNPVFDVVFSMLNYEDYSVNIDTLSFEYFENETRAEVYDIRVEVIESPEGFKGIFKYSSELFKRDTVLTLANDFTRILEIIAEDIDTKIKDIEIRQGLSKNKNSIFSEVNFNF